MKAFLFVLLAAGALHSYHIRFAAVVGNETFACDATYRGLGTTRAAATAEFLRLSVSQVALIDQSGKAVPGRYAAVRLVVGIPQSIDHADATAASSPLNLSDMFWSWQDNYKFFRFDARVRGSDGRTFGFVFQLGSTGCTGAAGGAA